MCYFNFFHSFIILWCFSVEKKLMLKKEWRCCGMICIKKYNRMKIGKKIINGYFSGLIFDCWWWWCWLWRWWRWWWTDDNGSGDDYRTNVKIISDKREKKNWKMYLWFMKEQIVIVNCHAYVLMVFVMKCSCFLWYFVVDKCDSLQLVFCDLYFILKKNHCDFSMANFS